MLKAPFADDDDLLPALPDETQDHYFSAFPRWNQRYRIDPDSEVRQDHLRHCCVALEDGLPASCLFVYLTHDDRSWAMHRFHDPHDLHPSRALYRPLLENSSIRCRRLVALRRNRLAVEPVFAFVRSVPVPPLLQPVLWHSSPPLSLAAIPASLSFQ